MKETCGTVLTPRVSHAQLDSNSYSSLTMANEVVEEGLCYEWSYIRGYHEYQAIWTPSIGEMLVLKVEPTNPHDDFTMSIVKDGAVVGHVPKYVSRVVCFFLKRVGGVGFCEVTGIKINRGVGLGLEIPCIYKFYGHQAYLDRLQALLLVATDDHTTLTTDARLT